jgi:hypothetical protein
MTTLSPDEQQFLMARIETFRCEIEDLVHEITGKDCKPDTTPDSALFKYLRDCLQNPDKAPADTVEAQVCQEIMRRRELGLLKYGIGLERTDLQMPEWIQHAKEESLDHSLYLHRLGQDCLKYPTAQAVADHINQIVKSISCDWEADIGEVITELQAIARRVSVLQSSEPQWIPVSKELPDADTTVLIANSAWGDPVSFGYFDGEDWFTYDEIMLDGFSEEANCNGPEFGPPTHWKDLPKPPTSAQSTH